MNNKVNVYNAKGETVKELVLNPAVFAVKVNPMVIHQVVVAMQANKRQNLAHVKDRGEVRGGGRKPWRQKGTGRARHGSSRSPIWIGGGVTFGPTNEQNFEQKINRKMKRKALLMALSDKVESNNLNVLDSLEINTFKTKNIRELLTMIKLEKSILFVAEKFTKELVKSVKNLPKVDVIEARNLNLLEVVKYKDIVMTEQAIKALDDMIVFKDDKKDETDNESVEKVNKKNVAVEK
ncbi:50S ribosomal protein L4 [Candidatus Falkowbacteria bacterium RIFOXYD2_FULL_35_9]|uniref:Large ribosomal subunit protein uL4 n=1 Tax=Candidatus Falkowbacteria bacterium RIFOXYC2_FULL_36_12 TaxID=1798002 RepID=A0A1F5SWG3_9BACT|nr:MAG: 50S ribosomal protein L4 [Candidatus Falkowbacteria bacterium RIFOXYB2_FULL_35_7]OGF30979.1 MAG: 50S ribosomal protein L4 [Candidatus Falkowbacteria bacterium RIFOXYC2_FULL_36_12]OGF34407.1 MAG: 50S ribosomal protein L4 [Candidatus Falkowbacteria bacterium RIFOXYA2_FULL_35_8]OGF47304.1 MAG: 50S ribosomal protein L4 [Candidatus Falkowbacteria bacterium RIFOXYD2_FULL_35_9]